MTKVIAIILLISNVFGEKNTVCHPKERLSQCYSEMEQNPINSTNMAMIRIKRGSGYLTARSDIISGTSRMSIKRPPFTLVGGVITNLSIRLELHNGRLSGSINVNDGPHSGSLTRARKKASDFGRHEFCDKCIFHFTGNIFTDCVNGHCPTGVKSKNTMENYVACPKDFIRAANCPSSKPYFLDDKLDFQAEKGGTVRMQCRVGGEVTKIDFYRDDLKQEGVFALLKDPLIDSPERVEIERYSSLAVLVIKNVSLSDEGSYTCQASNWHGYVSRSIRLNIQGGIRTACKQCRFPFVYHKWRFECTSAGASFNWCATELNSNWKYTSYMTCPDNFRNKTLSCPKKWSQHSWCDKCHFPFYSYVTKSLIFDCTTDTFRNKPWNRWCYTEKFRGNTRTDWEYCPPDFNGHDCFLYDAERIEFSHMPKDEVTFEGANVTMFCPQINWPHPYKETWTRLGYDDKDDVTPGKQKSEGRWQLDNVQPDDSGVYICRFESLENTIAWSIKLTVSGSEPTFDDYTGRKLRMDANAGDSVNFDCRGSSVIKGDLTLKFSRIPDYDGGPIPNLQTGRIVEGSGSDDNEHLRRVLKNVTKDDSGGYRCTLTNTVGSANRDFFLFVHYGEPYIINARQEVIKEYKGLKISFDCSGSGYPIPEFTFRRKGHNDSVVDKRFAWGSAEISNYVVYTIHIVQTVVQDSGDYECVFTNDKGTAIKPISVHVVDDPYADVLQPDHDPFGNNSLNTPSFSFGDPPEYEIGILTLNDFYWILKKMTQEEWLKILHFMDDHLQCTDYLLGYFHRIPNSHLEFAKMLIEDPGMTQKEFSYHIEYHWFIYPECAYVFTQFLPQQPPPPHGNIPTPSLYNFKQSHIVDFYKKISDSDWKKLTDFFDLKPNCKSNIQVWAGTGKMPKNGKEMADKISQLNEYQYWYFDQLYNDNLDCKAHMTEMLKKYNIGT